MKKSVLLLLLVFLLHFSACGTNTPKTTETPTGIPQNNEAVQGENPSSLQPLVLEIPAEDRCAMTSNCRFAETAHGYYMLRTDYLFYADKVDLSNWVLVCNKPSCDHKRDSCDAFTNIFWPIDDGFFYITDCIDQKNLGGHYFVKRDLDGSSPQLIFTDPILHGNTNGATLRTDFGTKDSFYRCITAMQEDGNWNCLVLRADQHGVRTLFSSVYPPATTGGIPLPWIHNGAASIRGDLVLESQFPLDGTPDENKEDWASREFNLYYQVYGDSIRALKLSENCDLYGAYISGNSLWHYHMNDGFYYMDLSTGEEVKIADAAYENAYGHCVDGKHMVECSLSVPGYTRDATEAKMRYFDGETWHELELPEHWNPQYKFRVLAGASDRIVFTVDDDAERSYDRQQELGYIILGEDSLTICDKYPSRVSFD